MQYVTNVPILTLFMLLNALVNNLKYFQNKTKHA